ncbi:coproporphyrinogen dehydrogenase HemZ [Caldisalinibacter kiritimatiensis]|uniref:Putative radical SAM family enzyme, NOT coproporphyrinogen III oxidase, oxygen-independent n=1 Tax=Caldisalinibacter kiritimatiensis TaxID=1304284 RepID=R1CVI3_9FIRM|nr:coproporphyrinogen dehydrogenase HemZ [Caldisalinibacter kiritimatiensis]EOD00654.1 Putative radical SAM family enzyme, NOT coproporphyrinogen III oxidase, oxygen-independent [Caldisalinibacter kiritimatiensis]
MINVYLKGHDYKYEVQNIIKVFYFNEKIEFIKKEALVNDQSLLIENILYQENDDYFIETIVYKNNECISKSEIKKVSDIDIKEDNLNKKIKLGIKQSLYEALSQITSVNAPWGILTGIRPTKIVHDLLDKSCKIEEIKDVLTKQYKVSLEKSKLIIDIASNERKFLYPLDEDKFSLYISIPFCPTRCLYCSFPSHSLEKWGHLVDEYTENLLMEIKQTAELLADKKIQTVYIGGGTPTSIPKENLDKIIKEVYSCFGTDIKEFTVEAGRPDTIDKDKLVMLKNNEIDRISINPQTMCTDTLSLIGRHHSPQEIIEAFRLAKEVGFHTINMDLIVGLPNEDINNFKHTMEEVLRLNPENLTVHTMAIKRASKLRSKLVKYSLTAQNKIEEMLELTKKYAEKMDMYPYYLYRQKQILGNFENVGYTKKNKECIYNILIMEERQTIIAVGAGGISKIYYPSENRLERVPNVKNVVEYNKRVKEMIERKKKFLKPVDRV